METVPKNTSETNTIPYTPEQPTPPSIAELERTDFSIAYFSDLAHQEVIRSLESHFFEAIRDKDTPPDLVTWEDLEEILTTDEMTAIRHLRNINPETIGFHGPPVDEGGEGSDFVALENQHYYTEDGEERFLSPKFMPNHIRDKIELINEWMQQDGVEPIIVESGYRSPAYQAIVFLRFLAKNDFNLEKTARRVALPGYSEHGSLSNTAVDVTTESFLRLEASGKASASDFAHTGAYQWLTTKGSELGVVQTYTEDNRFGIQPEPWHFTVSNERILVEPTAQQPHV